MTKDPDNPFNRQPLTPKAEETREIIIQMMYGGFMLFAYIIGIVAMLYVAWNLLLLAEWRQTDYVCTTFQEQAETFKDFYLTENQSMRCADYEINAPRWIPYVQ